MSTRSQILPAAFGVALALAMAQPASATLQGGRTALERNDYESALREFQEAAQAGNSDAQYELGLLYMLGRGGINQDHRQAVTWFSRAAEQGNPRAQVRLADMSAQGLGVPQDYDKARQLLRAALPRLQDAEKRYANDYAERIDAFLQARATQPAAVTGRATPAAPARSQQTNRSR